MPHKCTYQCTHVHAHVHALVQLVLVCNEARGIRLCNMLQMATASLQNVLCVVLSAPLHLSGHAWGKANRDSPYLCCCIVCVYVRVCVCMYPSAFTVCWNCALMDEKEKLTNLPLQWFPAIHYNVLYMLCNIEMNLFGYIQSIFSVIILRYFAKASGLAVNFSADVFSPAGWKSAVALLLWRNSFCPQKPTNTSLIKVVRAA